jgi:glycerophosphoryl diester phosphodiesterase
MLIIGHRGAGGEKPENTIAALRTGIESGADMLEFDIRVTRDNVPVLAHDFHMLRTNRKIDYIARHTLDELTKRTSGSDHPTVTLETALKETFGKILLNIEIKEYRSIIPMLDALKPYLKKKSDWELVVFSSFNPLILTKLRRKAPRASLAMIHYHNPLGFMAWQIPLRLSGAGFHRLHTSRFALAVAKKLGMFTYVYTVNRPDAAKLLAEQGVDGIVTDFPTKFVAEREKLKI